MSYKSAVEDMSLPLSSSHFHESYKSTAPSLNPTAPPLTPDTLPSTTSSDENVKNHHHLFHSDYAVVVEKEYSLFQRRSRNDDPTMENNVTLWTPIPLDRRYHIQDPDDERNTFEEDRSSSRGRKISFRKMIRSVIMGGIGGTSPRRKLHKSKDSTAASFATSLQTPRLCNLSSRVDSE